MTGMEDASSVDGRRASRASSASTDSTSSFGFSSPARKVAAARTEHATAQVQPKTDAIPLAVVGEWDQFRYAAKVATLGWLLQYLPSVVVGGAANAHYHLLPALSFAVVMIGLLLDHFFFYKTRRLALISKTK